MAEAQAQDMPLVWPAMSADDRAAAQPNESGPGLAQLLIFLAATLAFVAIAVRTVLKLTAPRRAKPERREPVRVAEPVIRRRERGRIAPEPSIEAMSEPAIARLREVAKRWDTPARVPAPPGLRGRVRLRGQDRAAPPPCGGVAPPSPLVPAKAGTQVLRKSLGFPACAGYERGEKS